MTIDFQLKKKNKKKLKKNYKNKTVQQIHVICHKQT